MLIFSNGIFHRSFEVGYLLILITCSLVTILFVVQVTVKAYLVWTALGSGADLTDERAITAASRIIVVSPSNPLKSSKSSSGVWFLGDSSGEGLLDDVFIWALGSALGR